jgi:hypothetical protein|nr:hypothetical protein [Candidatus Acidoferrales bacterium]
MNSKLCTGLLFLSIVMSGCATARMYPVQGPLATQSPGTVYSAKLTGLLYSGDITITTPSGEVCKGRWSLVKGAASADPTPASTPNPSATPDSTPVIAGMPAAWDTVYGKGYYVAHVLGQNAYAHSTVTGNRGTVLDVDFYKVDNGPHGHPPLEIYGVAKDNQGDVFKLAFFDDGN